MKNLSIKSKIYLILQIIFMVLTFVGGILLLLDKIDNPGMSVCCMCFSEVFGNLYNSSKKVNNDIQFDGAKFGKIVL